VTVYYMYHYEPSLKEEGLYKIIGKWFHMIYFEHKYVCEKEVQFCTSWIWTENVLDDHVKTFYEIIVNREYMSEFFDDYLLEVYPVDDVYEIISCYRGKEGKISEHDIVGHFPKYSDDLVTHYISFKISCGTDELESIKINVVNINTLERKEIPLKKDVLRENNLVTVLDLKKFKNISEFHNFIIRIVGLR